MTDKDSGTVASEYSCEGIASRQYSKTSKEKFSATASVSRHTESRDEGIGSNTPLHAYQIRALYDGMETSMQIVLTIIAEKLQLLEACQKRCDLKELDKVEGEIYDILGEKVDDIRKAISAGSSRAYSEKLKEDLEPGIDCGSLNGHSDVYVVANRPIISAITNRNCEQNSLLSCSLPSIFPGHADHHCSTTNLIAPKLDGSILSSQPSANKVTNLIKQKSENSDVMTNTDDLHLQNRTTSDLIHLHPGPENLTEVISSDPSTSDTDLKQELLKSVDSDSISTQSSTQEISKEKDPGHTNLMTHTDIATALDSRTIELSSHQWKNINSNLPKCSENKTASCNLEVQEELQFDLAFEKGSEVTNNQNLLLIPIQQNNEHTFVEKSTGKYTLICYYSVDCCLHRSSQEINVNNITLNAATCKMFYFNGKISLLIGKLNTSNKTWKSSCYSLDTEGPLATFKLISYFSLSVPESNFDFENCIPLSHKDGGVIITSVLNERIVFHILSKSISGKKWASAFSMLSQSQLHSTKFKIQSCIVESNILHCSLVQRGIAARICQFNIRILQQHQRNSINVRPICTWHIKDDPTLENCFISVNNGEVTIICCNNVNNKTTIEIKRPKSNSTAVSSALHSFEFPYIVNIIEASAVPCSESLVITVTYCDNEDNKCYIKRIDM